MATVIVFCSSFLSLVFPAVGSFTSTPFCSIGVMTMKMMSRTIMMSAIGVTLMSAMAPPLFSPTFMLMTCPSNPAGPARDARRDAACSRLGALLDEVVEQLRAGVVHLHVEALDLPREVVVRPDGGNGDEEPESRGDQRFGDAGGDGGDAARSGEGHP